jgi:DNA-binding HxlR family transcriptional regulator
MSEHTYGQYCPTAHALDLVGDRWALLIVRNLVLGPKRFTDLRAGLPGIGTNILTARLKHLETAGVVARRVLPPPAASTVYELTPLGAELRPVLTALARWGAKTLGPYESDLFFNPDTAMLTPGVFFRGLAVAGARGAYAVSLCRVSQDVTFGITIAADGVVSLSPEPPAAPDVSMETDAETVVGLIGAKETLAAAVARGAVRLEGDPGAVARLLEAGEVAGRPRGSPL